MLVGHIIEYSVPREPVTVISPRRSVALALILLSEPFTIMSPTLVVILLLVLIAKRESVICVIQGNGREIAIFAINFTITIPFENEGHIIIIAILQRQICVPFSIETAEITQGHVITVDNGCLSFVYGNLFT